MAIHSQASRANSTPFLPSQPLNASTANPNAATAAISAFTRRESSTVSLSAAAAAAALKARPTTPTNVAEIQTKRNTRRTASRSSSAGRSTPDIPARPGGQLRRQASSGSMTERTFRSSSPGAHTHTQRSLSSGGMPRNSYHSDEMAPPVPAIPQSVNMQAAKARPRPKSLGIVTAPVRTASQKAKGAQGSWFGAAKTGDPANVRTSDAIMATSPTAQTQTQTQTHAHAQADAQPRESLERPDSRGSPVNFSYPARIRSPTFGRPEEVPQQPTSVAEPRMKTKKRSSTMSPQRGGSVRSARSSSVTSDQTLVYDPNSRRMVPQADLSALEQRVQTASEARPKKKKQAPARAGSHLAKGTVSRPQGSAVASSSTNAAQVAAATSLRSHQAEDRQTVVREPEDEDDQPPLQTASNPLRPAETQQKAGVEPSQDRYAQVSISPASNAPEVVAAPGSPTADLHETGLQRKPSVVREEPESEDLESEVELEAPARVLTPPKAPAAVASVPPRQNVYAHGVPSPPRSDLTEDVPAEPSRPPPAIPTELAAAEPKSSSEVRPVTREVIAESRAMQDIQRDPRTHSKSPPRNARFGLVHDSLTVRHEPPPRSISPRKSALKHQSPSRGASPADAASDGSEAGIPSYEQAMPRKKSVRVSFDDGNTIVVGESAGRADADSPLPPSPQVASRRPWYSSLGIGKKKDAVPLEEDEVMKPRPMLPTFGSVRGRKQSPKEPEERPLVRPQEPVHEEPEPASPQPLGRGADIVGQSSDHALGAVIHEHEPKNEANISKFREPLPPVVTSVEGSGYASDTASDDSEAALMADTPRLQADESRVSEASTLVPEWKPTNGFAHERAGGEQPVRDVKDFARESHDVRAEVPAISVTQPSPHIIEAEQDQASYRFPGEFPETDVESDAESKYRANDLTSTDSFAPTRQVAFEPVVQKEDASATEHTPNTVLATKPAVQVTDESDGDSVYSDAYEDPLDLEGDGFQSLDAVIESPPREMPPQLDIGQKRAAESSTPTPSLPHKAPGHETAAIAQIQKEGTSGPIDDWAAAKAYWRSLTTDKRAQLEKEAAEEAGAEGDLEDVKPEVKKPRRKKSIEKRSAEKKVIEEQRAAVDPGRTYMIKPGSQAEPYSPTGHSMLRGTQVSGEEKEAGTKLRKTMRSPDSKPSQPAQPSESGTRMRRSLRPGAPGRSTATPQQPASSPPALGITTEITGPNRHSRAVSELEGRPSTTQPSLRRRGSDSSASSFKRSRPASQGFGFRKTMRTENGPQDPEETTRSRQPSRLSLRSMSPGGGVGSSLRGQPPVTMDGKMRTTLRGAPPANKRRGSQDSGKGYLRFSGSFGQKAKKKKGSRFGDDSSDEDEADVPRRFSSRFDDSSDEELAPEPVPSLSIPKTMRGARSRNTLPSPPLPEEEELSDDQRPVAGDEDDKSHRVTSGPASLPHSQTEPGIKRSRSGRGSLPRADDALGRPARRSFMSSVLRRNKKQGSGAISRPERKESAARADTDLERSAGELNALRSNGLRDRVDSGATWPLNEEGPDHEAVGVETRESDDVKGAQVIDGAGAVVNGERSPSVLGHSKSQPSLPRPSFLQKRTLSHQGTIDTDIIGSEAGGRKKKKFGVLRRMFKLDE